MENAIFRKCNLRLCIWWKKKIEKNRKTNFPNFITHEEEDVHHCVSLSFKKLYLLVKEIKKVKPSTESNDLRVTDFTKNKKRKLGFEPQLRNVDIIKVSTIINEIGLYKIVQEYYQWNRTK